MAKKREFSTFSLSFLDIMSCGFGAVILVFLIIKHDVNTQVEQQNKFLQAEVNLLEEEVLEGEQQLVKVKNTISLFEQDLVKTMGLAKKINNEIDAVNDHLVKLDQEGDDQQIIEMRKALQSLLTEKEQLDKMKNQGNNARRFIGVGNRQYLTGLQLGGSRTLILLDTSASMLDSSIVNIIRRRNMSDSAKKSSKKWQRAVRTVEWLLAKLPLESQFQLYLFNTSVQASLTDTEGQWLALSNEKKLDESIKKLKGTVPSGGTSLEHAFVSIRALSPLPDNIILITDGLPTQGLQASKKGTISGAEREKLFALALAQLPQGIPVNTLLWPMEGDPIAASSFWKLAKLTAGSFMSPSKDWP
jgi:hypothetical protein